MTDERIRYFAERMDILSRRDRVLINNPVIATGLGLAPIVIAGTTVQNAVVLAAAMAMMLIPTRVIATLIGQHTGFKVRAVLYAVISGAMFVAVSYGLELLFGVSAIRSVGIYLPLLVLEPLIIKRYESEKSERVSTSIKKGFFTTLGFCLVLFVSAGIREVLGRGTFAGVEVLKTALLPMAAMPAGGFIIMGLLIAVWRGFVNEFKKRVSKGAKGLK